MTQKEELENKQIDLINYLINLNNEITTTWTYHPENPNRIDPVMYHAILVEKAKKVEDEIDELIKQNGSI